MRKLVRALIILSYLFISSSGNTQTIHVSLNNLSTLDDNATHLTLLKSKPNVRLQIPKVDTTNAKFCDVFYTGREDPMIDIMVIPRESVDELYIDLNNDENLTNDGSPYIFKHAENSFSFDVISNNDDNQKTKLVLQRKPEMPDSGAAASFVDKDGNLPEKLAKQYGVMKGDFNYKGEKGTFYFDDRVTLRRGILSIDGKSIVFGLFDFTNNGLFSDNEDVIIIDLNNDEKLEYGNEHEVFKMNDVFTVYSNNYKIYKIDKYGQWIELVKTEEEATFYFLKEYQKMIADHALKHGTMGEIDQSFWELNLITLKNEKIDIKDFKGKFILLNFWGEWCKPCVSEIPDIIKISDKYSNRKLQLISFLKSYNLEKAKKMIREKNINWPQIPLSNVIESHFKIKGYPTNILIFPDGKQYIQTGQINMEFVMNYIK